MAQVPSLSVVEASSADAPSERVGSRAPVPIGSWHLPFGPCAENEPSWASGPDYKVAVDGAMTFVPVLGADRHERLTWRWETEQIAIGATSMLGAADRPKTSAEGFRAEIDHGGGVVEIYEVRVDGVEQSFRLDAPRAPFHGDLVVTGRILSELRADARTDVIAPILFADRSGTAIVRYGSAVAIDAVGRRRDMTTSFDGERIRLTLDGEWLKSAAWPVIVDPLVARLPLGASVNGAADSPQIVRSVVRSRLFVAETRPVNALDWDLVVRAYTDGFAPLGTIYSRLGTTSTRSAALAVADGSDRLVVAVGNETIFQRWVSIYVHDCVSLVENSGSSFDVPRPADTHDTVPSLGGSASGEVYLAFRRDGTQLPGDSAQSRVFGATIDVQPAGILSGPVDLHTLPGNNYDAAHPHVSGYSETGGWMVVWQEYNYDNPADDWDVIAQRIAPNGSPIGGAALGEASQAGVHKMTPFVAGSGSRFAVAYVTRSNTGTKELETTGNVLRFQRVDWSSVGAASISPSVVVEGSLPTVIELGTRNAAMAFDHRTDSLWAVAWRRDDSGELRVARIGFDSIVAERSVIEARTLVGSFGPASLCFDEFVFGFPLVYGSSGVAAMDPVYGNRFDHGNAITATEGTPCPGSLGTFNGGAGSRPFAGSEFFGLKLTGGRANAPSVLVLGLLHGTIPLPGSSAGCELKIDPNGLILNVAYGITDGIGEWSVPIPIPSDISDVPLFWQVVQLDAGELWSTNKRTVVAR